jgi:hypothetical protein
MILSRDCHPNSCKQIRETKTGVVNATSLFCERYFIFYYGKENQIFIVFEQERAREECM